MDVSQMEERYLQSLTKKEKDAYFIAKSILGSSFSLHNSLGFIQWFQSKEKENENEKEKEKEKENEKKKNE